MTGKARHCLRLKRLDIDTYPEAVGLRRYRSWVPQQRSSSRCTSCWLRENVAVSVLVACLLSSASVIAQSFSPTPPFYSEWTFHVLVGVVAAAAGVFGHRAWSRRRWRSAPAGVVIEAVLAVDLVNSTWLATHHGEALAMRARNLLERRALAASKPRGVTFVENTGDGCMMTFPSVVAAAQAASKLLRGLRDRPPHMAPGPAIEVRAAIAYGQILLDVHGGRHGTTINEAFRLMNLPIEDFVIVQGEERATEIPDRNRVFLDEDAANELRSTDVAFSQVGVCQLKGFTGFHRVYQLQWNGK